MADSPPVLPPVPGTPNGPEASDPGINPQPGIDWKYWLNPFDYNPAPAFKAGQDFGNSAQDVAAGWVKPLTDWVGMEAPIAGTFALLAVVFVVGLVMFLNESGGGEVVAAATGNVAGAVGAHRERKAKAAKQKASDDALIAKSKAKYAKAAAEGRLRQE